MNYNLTNLTTATDFSGVVTFANNSVGGLLIGGMYIGVFFVLLVGLKRYDFKDALIVSSWTTFVLGLLLSYGGYLSIYLALIFLAIAGFTTIWTVSKESGI